jgi:hypothetical protein
MLKKTLKAIGLASVFITGTLFQAEAQIAEEFECVEIVSGKSYTPINGILIPKSDFVTGAFGNTPDPDNGFRRNVPIGFNYEFNGMTYSTVNINVNGFITFNPPVLLSQEDPTGLFRNQANSFQNNVIAPYWGDHYYRDVSDVGFQPGSIRYGNVTDANGERAFVVEWRNIQINDPLIPSSVGNFQVWLYESQDPLSRQGSIEFAYGQVGPIVQGIGTVVETRGASIGIKGTNGDFVNGLRFEANGGTTQQTCNLSKTDATTLTDQWPPSGGTDKRIVLSAIISFRLANFWGDGDADLSKAPNGRHAQLFDQQNRYVTMNDVKTILRSVATSRPLDSVFARNAYHADVNHDGRYFYFNQVVNGVNTRTKRDLEIRSELYTQDLPLNLISDANAIFFQTDEYDAAMIIKYLNARLPVLPWIYDWDPRDNDREKLSAATAVRFGELNRRSSDLVEVPVYLNKKHDGVIALRLDVSGKIINASSSENTVVEFHNNRVVLAGEGKYDVNMPIMTLLVEADGDIEANDIAFNGNEIGSISTSTQDANDLTLNVSVYPNPVVDNASFTIAIPEAGSYSLDVYDINGSLVKNIMDSNLDAQEYTFEWDGTDNSDNTISEGLYVYRLSGANGYNITKTLVIGK